MNLQPELSSFIDHLIRQNACFAMYRLPNEDEPHWVAQRTGLPTVLPSLSALNGREGFVIAPFHPSEACPPVVIRPDIHLHGQAAILRHREWQAATPPATANATDSPGGRPESTPDDTPERYGTAFHRFHTALAAGRFQKLVLSRSFRTTLPLGQTPGSIFVRACNRYPQAMNYICHTPQSGLWLGCTPEILLTVQNGTGHTVALAGTMPAPDGDLPTAWDAKNRLEQEVVCEYLRAQLRAHGITPQEEGPYTARAGSVVHLKSDFRFALPARTRLGDLVASLHPTPAVCGLPKAETYAFIHDTEQLDRRYYAGFIGPVDAQGNASLYVNLRCTTVEGHQALLYAGGGILPSSEVHAEWEETCHKLKTIQQILHD